MSSARVTQFSLRESLVTRPSRLVLWAVAEPKRASLYIRFVTVSLAKASYMTKSSISTAGCCQMQLDTGNCEKLWVLLKSICTVVFQVKKNLPKWKLDCSPACESWGSHVLVNALHNFRAYILPFLTTIHHNLTASGKKIAHAQICTSSVLNNTKNIVSKTTLMKCQLSLGSKPT